MKIEKLRKIKRNTKMLGCLRELRRSYNTKTLEILFSKKYNYKLKVALYFFSFIFDNILFYHSCSKKNFKLYLISYRF